MQVTTLKDVKVSKNEMYVAKLNGEGAAMYDVTIVLKDAMVKLR